MRSRILVATGLVLALAGCGAPAPPAPAPAPAPTAAPSPGAPSTGAAASPDDAACTNDPGTADTIRGIAAVAQRQPVLPAAVALLLLDARQKTSGAGLTDPVLIVAQAELLAAIDELDAQGKAGLPPGGNATKDKVKLDMTRALAAVAGVEKACAARKG